MHRIDGPGATIDGRFTEGDPIAGVPATTVTGDWLNALQDEVVNVIEGAGAALDKEDDAQLLDAIVALIDAAIAEVPVFVTGDVRLTLRNTAAPGWVLADDGTIGDAGSGATTRAHADCEALFTLLWDNVSDTHAPVSGGRGASAAADFAAGKTIGLTKMLGRALAIAGSGSGLTSRSLGQTVGAETHALTASQMPSHTHLVFRNVEGDGDPPTSSEAAAQRETTSFGDSSYQICGSGGVANIGETSSAGSGSAHNNMQPTAFLNAEIKL